MTDLILYHAPGACSQVCLVGLETAGLPYELKIIDMKAGEQNSPAHLAVSPLGKVPALAAEGTVIVENGAIQTYLAALAPAAGLFPEATTPLALARRQTGLSFCGGSLHPIVRGLFNPGRLTTTDEAGVRARATELADKNFAFAERQLAEQGWWLGPWSLIDCYLDWAISVARRAGYDFARFPQLDGLHARLLERPAFARAMAIEADAQAKLDASRQ